MSVTVVGAGLAGSEAAFQLAERGVAVRLSEMKPQKRTPAQSLDDFGELVCSNSLRGAALANAVGLLKEELRRVGSLVMRVADLTRVPAGGALAVDREAFAREITRVLRSHPNITIDPREVTAIPTDRPVILATGPLTSDALASDLERVVGRGHLAYYDAIAPIVATESIDFDKVFRQSRYGKGGPPGGGAEGTEAGGDDAYLNCPFDEDEYKAFVHALVTAEKVEPRAFEEIRYFEGCLPCEVMAERGERTLAFGPMKPVGLIDPRTGKRPYAVVQLRAEDGAMTAYNLVGFQTRMKYPEQQRVFRMIPGLENAEFLRLGSVHRNTFVDGPVVLDERLQLKAAPGVYLAGQITGVEGYVESAASGLLCATFLADTLQGLPHRRPAPTTALGALLTHVSRPPVTATYQPSNITWAHFPPLEAADASPQKRKKIPKTERYAQMAERALIDIARFAAPGSAPQGSAPQGTSTSFPVV